MIGEASRVLFVLVVGVVGASIPLLVTWPRRVRAKRAATAAPSEQAVHWWSTFAPFTLDLRLGAAIVVAAAIAFTHAWILAVVGGVAAWAVADLYLTEPLVVGQILELRDLASWATTLASSGLSQRSFAMRLASALDAARANRFVAGRRREVYERLVVADSAEREDLRRELVLADRDPISVLADTVVFLAASGEGADVGKLLGLLADQAERAAETYQTVARQVIMPDIAQGRAMGAILVAFAIGVAWLQHAFFAAHPGAGVVLQLVDAVAIGTAIVIAASARVPWRYELVFR